MIPCDNPPDANKRYKVDTDDLNVEQPYPAVGARMHSKQAEALGLAAGDSVLVKQGEGSAVLKVRIDNHVAMGCVRIQAASPVTASLGELMGDITVEKIAVEQANSEAVA